MAKRSKYDITRLLPILDVSMCSAEESKIKNTCRGLKSESKQTLKETR